MENLRSNFPSNFYSEVTISATSLKTVKITSTSTCIMIFKLLFRSKNIIIIILLSDHGTSTRIIIFKLLFRSYYISHIFKTVKITSTSTRIMIFRLLFRCYYIILVTSLKIIQITGTCTMIVLFTKSWFCLIADRKLWCFCGHFFCSWFSHTT